MAEDRQFEDPYEDQSRRPAGRDAQRRRAAAPNSSRTRGRGKRGAPAKFNGIHRRRSKRSSW